MALPWVVMLSACIRTVAPGPDLGPCAEPPDGTYGYGEAGIGSCIAGPADIRFFEQDGGTFLAVTNADPFRDFLTGSVLVIDWDDVAARLADDPPDRILTADLPTSAIELFDDDDGDGEGNNPYLGGFGYLAAHQAALVTSRLTEGAVLRSGRDDVFVLDLSRMELTGGGIEVIDQFELEDDPFPVIVDDPNQRVYVGNLTDHSVSVLSSETPPAPADDVVHVIDVAPGASTSRASFVDVDDSGSEAVLSTLSVFDVDEIIEDQWTLTFVDTSVRVWVPTPIPDSIDGLVMYSSGDLQTYIESPLGIELGLGEVRDPFLTIDTLSQLPVMWFGRSSDGDIHRAIGSSQAGDWFYDRVVLSGGGVFGGPSLAPLPGQIGLYVDRRDDGTSPAAIALAASTDNETFVLEDDVLVPPDDGTSFEDPYAVYDAIIGRYRMWLTVRAPDGTFTIALSESLDGRIWSAPATVLDPATQPDSILDPATGYGAPTVAVLESRYGMWFTRTDADGWSHAFAWSYDGRHWTDPEIVVPSEIPVEPVAPQVVSEPPRVALLATPIGGWRLEGVEQGALDALLTAGIGPIDLFEIEIEVTNGQEVDNGIVRDQMADRGLVPGSAVLLEGREILFATSVGSSSLERILALERIGEEWTVAIDPDDLAVMLGVDPGQVVSDPVVTADNDGYVMFFTLTDTDSSVIRRSTSPDGFVWDPPEGGQVIPSEEGDFDAASQFAHSIEVVDEGIRLWYSGFDGSTQRIGWATAPSIRDDFERNPGPDNDWQFGTGLPGGFDDSSVKDPLVITLDGETHLYYAGNDGLIWHIGHALVLPDGEIERRIDPVSELPYPTMNGTTRTFSSAGVEGPVAGWALDTDPIELFYAGLDTFDVETSAHRIGRAIIGPDTPDEVFATQRFPTAGDFLPFSTTRGGSGDEVIELEQAVQEFVTLGYGMSGMALDSDRGFLYVTTKLDDTVFVLDIRDDSDGDFVDANALDFEALVQVDSGNAFAGFRDVVISPTRGLMFLTSRAPDGLVIVDLTRIPDNDIKDEILTAAVAVLPLQSLGDDAGVDTLSTIGGAGMALTADERFLLITHFRGNALSVIDLEQGAWGEEIAWIPNLGENPHIVRISPDGRWAVIANYLGDVDEDTVSSTLAVVDLDPASENYLEAVTWLANK